MRPCWEESSDGKFTLNINYLLDQFKWSGLICNCLFLRCDLAFHKEPRDGCHVLSIYTLHPNPNLCGSMLTPEPVGNLEPFLISRELVNNCLYG